MVAIARALDMAKTVGWGRDRRQRGVSQKSLKLEYLVLVGMHNVKEPRKEICSQDECSTVGIT